MYCRKLLVLDSLYNCGIGRFKIIWNAQVKGQQSLQGPLLKFHVTLDSALVVMNSNGSSRTIQHSRSFFLFRELCQNNFLLQKLKFGLETRARQVVRKS